ncbi:MAG: restriction endonuclease subunit R [Candidatus Viridilinea halotolerans]|uniref:Restriction endonuclease subunit R n=1 Tax=Candidatus Viridilinea halotolerans TaxID=2491704 RepID=A0A426U1C0_9CHLR|nr:MAG: restriction endonuclease subunit R [Candidatus Viridilinea halotolerans]
MPPRSTRAPRTSKATTRAKTQPTLDLEKRLVLNQWLLRRFGVASFDTLIDLLKIPDYEGYTDDNNTKYLATLIGLPNRNAALSEAMLREYDENIVRHWKQIVERRALAGGQPLFMKYFQYLALLFSEIYLDHYFRDAEGLCAMLTAQAAAFSAGKDPGDKVGTYSLDDLRKLAFWQATGSGKTLQMHVNILQYRHYLNKHGRTSELNRVILLTPNEGLSRQHLDEFGRSGMEAELFRKDGGKLFTSQSIEIIDINKLREDSGVKTVAVDAFEGNNLVLVDEGHRGSGGEDWMAKRRALVEQGFSFEYSATFKQAMKAAKDPALTEEYAKCIIFDYSYKYFYRDGYGKDYAIFNLGDDTQEEVRLSYLTGGLLAFYQQLRLYRDRPGAFTPYLLAQPLMIFVGGSVTKSTSKRDVSDVVDILHFLAAIVHPRQRNTVIRRIERLLGGQGQSGLLDEGKREIFANSFGYLLKRRLTAEQIYNDLLQVVFAAPAAGLLHVENLKGSDGEVGLRVGTNEPFGVINIGDAAGLIKEIERTNDVAIARGETEPLAVSEPEFAGSLFRRIEEANSPVNILIGSKKFTEGWSSWRVSSMGLMNVGQSEGSQIIQLFGRGVRLKGYNFSLKRSLQVQKELQIAAPEDIDCLETLTIFGVRASYMAEFRKYLEDEGLPASTNREMLTLPTIRPFENNPPRLRIIAVKDGIDFKRQGERPTLARISGTPHPAKVSLDWYPKIESQRSAGAHGGGDVVNKNEAELGPRQLAFMDFDAILFELLRFKNEKAWYNLNITRAGISDLLENPGWYTLSIPSEALELRSMGQVRVWQEIAVALLKKYCAVFYTFKRSEYEAPHLEYRDLEFDPEQNRNIIKEYSFAIEYSETNLITKLKDLIADIQRGVLKPLKVGGNNFEALCFACHLYQPLVYLDSKRVDVKPVALNEGERDFVLHLQAFHQANPAFFTDKDLYLLRNQSRGKGIGFFEAGNFYPDFILWLIYAGKQYVTFVDPKGLRNLRGPGDPKISFYRAIKNVEQRLSDPDIILNSFIVTPTPHQEVAHWNGGNGSMSISDFKARNVYFQADEPATYIMEILSKITNP